jgi:Fatty acid hydroxylase superfamily
MNYIYHILFALGCVFYYSLIEWLLHRFVMHKNIKWFNYPFATHTLVHHSKFRADKSYLGQNHPQEDLEKIPMAWWNGFVLVAVASLPLLGISALVGLWSYAIVSLIMGALSYGAYEYVHWCMHLPKKRRVEMLPYFRRINAHHLLHHRYMNSNFNVVFFFWDKVFGTLKVIADTPFAQALDPSIPNVQPRTP